jgi:hypothetical protein
MKEKYKIQLLKGLIAYNIGLFSITLFSIFYHFIVVNSPEIVACKILMIFAVCLLIPNYILRDIWEENVI